MNWKRVTIFISSTFNDMHAERDYLVKDVFPELREWCEERKIHLVDVDLRWGVTEEDSSSNHTVLACLNNIDESRPFFLCFLGQRRGWVPGKKDISSDTLDEYPDILEAIGRSSVTEMEIEHALLSPMRHIVNGNEKREIPVSHALFYFRNPDYLADLTTDQRKIFTNEAEKDIDLADKELINFKEKIKTQWGCTVDYDCNWDKSVISPELPENTCQGRLIDFNSDGKDLKNIILEQLKEEIINEFPDREKVDYASGLERDQDQQALFIELNSEGFISREGDFDALNDYVTSDKNGLFILTASAGSGKSMLLANFIIKESKKHHARFFNRFCGVSDLCSQQYSLWKTIFEEAHIECPDTFKELKDKIEDLLKELAREESVLIIDAINQLPDGLELLDWLPKRLPENLKIILSLKEDEKDNELMDHIEKLKENENISNSTVKPFNDKEEKKKLINDYLKKYLKALDDKQIDTICDFEGSKNPLYLKILLSELRVFGSFVQLSNEMQQFGETPKEAFNTVLNRLEKDVNSLGIVSKEFAPLLFGLLANARNGLSEKEIVSCMQKELGIDEEMLIQAIRLFIRQVRPFMARREGRTDYFYEAFKLAAQERYSYKKVHYNNLLADYFKEQADPEADLSFKGKNIRDLNELPYHLKESENTSCLEKILSTYLWIKNKSELSDIQNTINDYPYVKETEDNYYVKLIEKTLILSQHVLKENIKDNLPSQLWGRLKEIDNPEIKAFLIDLEKCTDYPWLKPRHHMESPEGALKMTLTGHTENVSCVCVSPDGKYIMSGSSDSTVRIWDLARREEVRRFEFDKKVNVYDTRFSPDGKYIVSGAEYGFVRIWDWENAKEIQRLDGHKNGVNSVCFSPDGKYIATGDDNAVRIWDWEKQEEIYKLQRIDKVRSICFSPDGKYVAAGAFDGDVWVWDLENRRRVCQLMGPTIYLTEICFSPDGKHIAVGFGDATVRIWDWENGEEIRKLDNSKKVGSVCFSPDGKYLVLCSSDLMVRVWDWKTLEEIVILDGHVSIVNRVCFSPDGKYVISGSWDRTVRVWDWDKQRGVQRVEKQTKRVGNLCFSPDGKCIISGSWEEKVVRVWAREEQKEILRFEEASERVCFSPDGKFFAAGGNATLNIWDWNIQKKIAKVELGESGRGGCIYFSPDGKYIASKAWYNKINYVSIWDWANGKEEQRLEVGVDKAESMCFSPNGQYIALGCGSYGVGFIQIWDWKNAREVHRFGDYKKMPVYSVCFSSDGKYLVSSSIDDAIKVFDCEEWKEVRRFEFEMNERTDVYFSSDDKYIVLVGSVTIKILDWKKQVRVIAINTKDSSGGGVISNDNRHIAAVEAGGLGRILIYDIENLYEKLAVSMESTPKQSAQFRQKKEKKGFFSRLFKR